MNRSKNFHVPLPPEVYLELRKAAESAKVPATKLARDVIQNWLMEVKKNSLHSQIAEYAAQNAGTANDLDKELENAGIEHLRKKK